MRFAFHEYFSISFKKYSPPTWVNYKRSSQDQGLKLTAICAKMEAMGIPTKIGKATWHQTNVRQILKAA